MTALRGDLTERSVASPILLGNVIRAAIIGAVMLAAVVGLGGLAGASISVTDLTGDLIGSWESMGKPDAACSSPAQFPKRLDFYFSGAYGYSNGPVMKSGVFATSHDALYLDQGGGAVIFHAAVFKLEFGNLLLLRSGSCQMAYYSGV